MDYDIAKKSFIAYTNQFDMSNKNIVLKQQHTFLVVHWMEKLAKRLGLAEEEIELAKIIGLLHDIGRFYQIEKTNSFDDTNLDHAQVGCQYLFKENHIRDFIKNDTYDHLIEFAIRNHNKLKIEKSSDAKERFFAKMIRDMDKLDIFRVKAVKYEMELIKEDITPACLKEFEKEESVDRKKIKTNTDSTLGALSFVFDINFKESYELLDESDNLELFISSLNIPRYSEDEAQKILQRVRNYLNKKIAD